LTPAKANVISTVVWDFDSDIQSDAVKRAMVSQSVIREMASRIVDKFNPLRVVLFGSYARGEVNSNSDVDLLVVMPNGTQTCEAAIAMMSELRDADTSKDVIVATPEVLAKFGDMPSMIYCRALREGRVLYERS
jgi:uncharacterized protein